MFMNFKEKNGFKNILKQFKGTSENTSVKSNKSKAEHFITKSH